MTTPLQVDHSSYGGYSREPSGDDWDNGDRWTQHSVSGVAIANTYGDVDADWEVKQGDDIYLVYAIYSVGCSFGRDAGGCIDYIAVFKTEEKASDLQKRLEADDGQKPFSYMTETGIEIPYRIPWHGYFESLDHVSVERFTVK